MVMKGSKRKSYFKLKAENVRPFALFPFIYLISDTLRQYQSYESISFALMIRMLIDGAMMNFTLTKKTVLINYHSIQPSSKQAYRIKYVIKSHTKNNNVLAIFPSLIFSSGYLCIALWMKKIFKMKLQ